MKYPESPSAEMHIGKLEEKLKAYEWTLAEESTPKRDPNCLANASYAVEVLYVGPLTGQVYRGANSRYLFDKDAWECHDHKNYQQTFEDIGYKVVAWRYYDEIPNDVLERIAAAHEEFFSFDPA